jgi:NAD(P)-dependent dehydrogenase (short-subunit alcohol dehydrogenase family)
MEIGGRVALVTGAASGIGRATAVRLAGEGAKVAVADMNQAGAEEATAAIHAAGGDAIALTIDVTDDVAFAALFEQVEQAFGGIDIMVNNAGVTSGGMFPDVSPAQWGRTLDINLRAVITGTQLAITALKKRGGGVILNTASIAGIMGFPPDPVYSATKGGVVLFTRSLAPLKDSHKIRVNCVCPGFVETPLLMGLGADAPPERRAMLAALPKLQPEDIADAFVSLIQDDNVAGEALRVAAGLPREFVPAPSLATLFAAGRV